MEENYNIDKHLRQSLNDFSLTPAAASFNSIVEKLEQKRKKKRALIFLYSGIGMLVILMLTISLVNAYAPEVKNKILSTTTPAVEPGKSPAPLFKPEDAKDEITRHKARSENKIPEKESFPTAARLAESEPSGAKAESFEKQIPVPDKNVKKERLNSAKNLSNPEITPNKITDPFSKQEVSSVSINEAKKAEKKPEPEQKDATPENVMNNTIAAEISANDSLPAVNLWPLTFKMQTVAVTDTFLQGPAAASLNTLALEYAPPLMTNTRRFKFMLAINFDPQYSSYILAKNKNRAAIYDSAQGGAFSENYLESKKEMNKPSFVYSYGIKGGVNIKDHWEIWAGIGFQKIRFNEKLYQVSTSFPNSGGVTMYPIQSLGNAISTIRLTYTYSYYGLELKRIVHLHPFLKINYGAGIRLERMTAVSISSKSNSGSSGTFYDAAGQGLSSLSGSVYRMDVKAGVIYDFGKRWQFRLSPGIFYSPTSLFNRTYIIKQKMYGLQLESMLVLKLYKD